MREETDLFSTEWGSVEDDESSSAGIHIQISRPWSIGRRVYRRRRTATSVDDRSQDSITTRRSMFFEAVITIDSKRHICRNTVLSRRLLRHSDDKLWPDLSDFAGSRDKLWRWQTGCHRLNLNKTVQDSRLMTFRYELRVIIINLKKSIYTAKF